MSVNQALQKNLMDVPVQIDLVLGEARLPMEELLAMDAGDVMALNASTSDLVDVYVSDRLMARGRLVIADGELGITLNEIVDERRAA